jgi:hypothetical protein
MAVRQDWPVKKGADWIWNLTATDGDGTIIDLTSATIKFRISSLTGTTVDTRQTGGSGISLVTATLGTYVVTVTPANQTSASIAASTNYKYEIQITTGAGTIYDQMEGVLKVEPTLFT